MSKQVGIVGADGGS